MINFLKYKSIFFALSLLFILPSAYFLMRFGFRPSIDFTGGTLIELTITPESSQSTPTVDDVQQSLQDFQLTSVQTTTNNSFLLRGLSLDQSQNQKILDTLKPLGEVEEHRFETVGPTLGKELIRKTLIGILLSSGIILAYVSFRFKDKKYGICAIIAMLHDSFILLGVFSFLGVYYQVEVDALFVTAVLTILSFSVHDTIVVYDRIRESMHHAQSISVSKRPSYRDIVNQAITETLGRSINNSLTIIFMLLALYLLGGQTTKWFVFALLIGTISGTYSSTFTAAPLLVLWDNIRAKKENQ